MKVNGQMTKFKEKANLSDKMEIFLKVIGMMIKLMEQACQLTILEINIKANGKII